MRQVQPANPKQIALGAPWWIKRLLSYVGTEDASQRLGAMSSDWVRRLEAHFISGYKVPLGKAHAFQGRAWAPKFKSSRLRPTWRGFPPAANVCGDCWGQAANLLERLCAWKPREARGPKFKEVVNALQAPGRVPPHLACAAALGGPDRKHS